MLLGKNVAILGLGVSGLETAKYLKQKGFSVFVSDSGQGKDILERAEMLTRFGIPNETGSHNRDEILRADWVMLSPGIAPSSEIYQLIQNSGIPILSEIEVAYAFSPTQKIIGVTGTSGKTTVSNLIAAMLKENGFNVVLCGNVGNPWIGELSSLNEDDWVVVELSSFQLKNCHRFKPYIGVLLNLSRNHEDWHADFQDYVVSKLKIFQNQTESEFSVFRRRDQENFFSSLKFDSKIRHFDADECADPNYAAVFMVGKICGIAEPVIKKVFSEFMGIEHRMEKLIPINGIYFINDSKATTTAALAWALKQQKDGSVFLIAGGHPKTNDFADVRSLVERKIKCAVLIGEARPLLANAWENATKLVEKSSVEEAVRYAFSEAKQGDTVLLSPACASFDMFKNYQHRGHSFKEAVEQLRKEKRSSVISVSSNV